MTRLAFSKMHGLGNDFVVIDALNQALTMTPELSRSLADRRFGIGCDQVLLVERPRLPGTEFHYRIFNADGSEVEQCGNGARCFARFVRLKGLTDHDEIPVGTAAGPILLRLQDDGQVSVDMGAPKLDPASIPFIAPFSEGAQATSYALQLDGETYRLGAISMGNPHGVLLVDDVDAAPVRTLGPKLEHHPCFPNRANIGFMQVQDPGSIRLRVWERGAGETLACGTGACAAVVSGILRGLLRSGDAGDVRVQLPGGSLVVNWPDADAPVRMTGPATLVYDGDIEL